MARFIPGPRTCPDCGDSFWAHEDWMKRCLDCYHIFKNGGPKGGGRKAASEWVGATPPPPRVEVRVEYRDRPDPDGEWLRKNLRALTILCHPDKHGGTDTANDITVYLIKRLREVKK